MPGKEKNSGRQQNSGGQLGRWLWLLGLVVGVLGGATVAVGFTSATAPSQSAE
jgi:hypothetical protein